jgi:hypothetical protein
LPELVADGDLDGDLYFVCWDETILSQIQPVPISGEQLIAKPSAAEDEATLRECNPGWCDEAQAYISRVPTLHANTGELVGRLYKASENMSVRDLDAVSFARAYKHALDSKKHGGNIFLPRHLWDRVDNKTKKPCIPEHLHQYLTPTSQ